MNLSSHKLFLTQPINFSLFQIRVSATVGPGQGSSVGLAGYYLKPGYCPSFSTGEKRGNLYTASSLKKTEYNLLKKTEYSKAICN